MNERMLFGKYRGQLLVELPDSYLRWLVSLDDLREPLRSHVHAEWTRRESEDAGHTTTRPAACPDPTISAELISAGLHSLALQHHPDRGGNPEKMVVINGCADWLRRQLRSLVG